MADPEIWTCQTCGNVGMDDGADGFFYCRRCGSQADDIIDTGVAEEDFADKGGDGGASLYLASHRRNRKAAAIKAEPISQSDSLFKTAAAASTIQSQFWASLTLDDENPNRDKIKTEEGDFNAGPFRDGVGPTEPEDFGYAGISIPSFEEYSNEMRIRYVMGLQLMIEFQCEALVREFKVSPLICGLAGTVWLRFVAGTRVFDDASVEEAISDYESQKRVDEAVNESQSQKEDLHNKYQRAIVILFRSLRKKIPVSFSLAVSFLACHLAREAVMTTDIVKWSLEGKLPYFAAFVEIEKRIGPPGSACPISSSFMFRPIESVTAQKLESLAAFIAESIGLALPPVNFYAIAARYLQKLSLPSEKILPHACRIYEWSMPSDLWLSTNKLRLPTRVCLMSILIVAIRILYNIHGFGEWEKSLFRPYTSSTSNWTEDSNPKHDSNMKENAGKDSGFPLLVDDSCTNHVRNASDAHKSELDSAELLCNLEAIYSGIDENHEYSKDLPTYLQYCKDVVFAGLEPSFEDHEEQKLIEKLWDFYLSQNGSRTADEDEGNCSTAPKHKRARVDKESRSCPPTEKKFRNKGHVSDTSSDNESCLQGSGQGSENSNQFDSSQDDQSSEHKDQASVDTQKAETVEILKEEAIRQMKFDMEENRFCYIPPRVNLKKFKYLHYVRKKDEGALSFVAHADYYILLRACAKVAQVEIRCMHIGVLSFERRLAWTEGRINHCLHLTPPTVSCQFCSDVGNTSDESLGLSNLNI